MKGKIGYSLHTLLSAMCCFAVLNISAQDWKTDKKVNIVFGLTQPLLVKGFNIEGNYIHHRWIADYSHGVSLDFSGASVTPELKRQGLAVHMPYTTGFGIGYRLKEWINIRVEPKWHRFEFYYDGESQTSNPAVTSYNTFSLGIGIYGHYQPFKKQENLLRGIMIAPSVRFWPTVSSSLDGDSYSYLNRITGKQENIGVLDPGIGFKPLIFNISVGYSFDLMRKADK
jgi:hypothetical protein